MVITLEMHGEGARHATRSRYYRIGQHAHALLFEGLLVLGFHRLVYYILEYLDDIVQVVVHALYLGTVSVVCFTVRAKHEQAPHDL
jgi:hypothetical protein